jgi:hypothetical protein
MAQEYSFEFTRDEHARACRAIYRHAIRRRWAKWLLRAGYVLMSVFLIVNTAVLELIEIAKGTS